MSAERVEVWPDLKSKSSTGSTMAARPVALSPMTYVTVQVWSSKNEAMVVDPRRDIQVYLDLAAKNGMTITHVTETHIHADYLSGTRELAHATGAQIHLSGEGGEDWAYGFEGNLLKDGDTVTLGNITVEAVHTVGPTPEHLSFLVTDGAFADAPGYMLTGDFVFSGDLGRPDLLDEAAGGVDTRF